LDLYNDSNNKFKNYKDDNLSSHIEKKIDSITKSLSKPYYNNILKNLLKSNEENAVIIYDYIIAEQTELNIKDSTKEGKIKDSCLAFKLS
jgi:hypothetical protein